jgi:hypothetical protein
MAMGTADANPVFRRDFKEVEIADAGGLKVFHQAATQAKPDGGLG